jgi:tRNA pseudouridine32 synthase/23S rRNA pseudouridine746 synthase/23S rRNA pseudouridine955/2504/2580 synthase
VTLPVLRLADAWVAVDKPAGMAVIPGRPGANAAPTAREQLEDELKRKLWVVHRLDRDTSGVLLFALSAEAHRELSMAFERSEVKKRYLALVQGAVAGPWVAEQALVPARRSRMRVARPGEEGKAALTRFTVRQTWKSVSLLEAVPETGRTHQIRVHLQAAGHPLVVDHQYGRHEPVLAQEWGGPVGEVVLARTPLHAQAVEFSLNGEAQSVVAPLPPDMQRAVALLSAGL